MSQRLIEAPATARKVAVAGLVAVAALLVPGCGDDEEGSPAPPKAKQPTPKRPISAEIGPFNEAIARQSCEAHQPLVFSFVRGRRPGAPATAEECKGVTLRVLRGDPLDRARRFRTGAVVDGPAPGARRRYTLWALDGDGRFRFTQVTGVTSPEIDTPFTRRAEAARVANDFLRAIRRRDCAAMEGLFTRRASRLVVGEGSRRRACRAVLKGKFLAPAVRKTRRLRIEVLGGTRRLAFVGVPTRDTYFTMLLGGVGTPSLGVLDVLPSTPVKLPKR